MKKPEICWPDIVDGWFNLGPDTCEINMEDPEVRKKNIINMLKKYQVIKKSFSQEKIKKRYENIKFLAWPLTNTFDPIDRTREIDIM